MTIFLDNDKLTAFPTESFTGQPPFPWFDFPGLLTPEGFDALYREFPPLDRFEKHTGMERAHGQRPHDRYYLAYESSIYDKIARDTQGEIKRDELPLPWQGFMVELETSTVYHAFIERLLGVTPLSARYAWHVGITGSEVSPHRDSDNKIGTHIFYFNTHDDWNPAWGGSTLVLDGKKVTALNPDFTDFTGETPSQIIDNHSFLFKNTPSAWHGVRTLTSPPGHYRRLFNVIFQVSDKKEQGLGARLKKVFGR